LFREGAGGPVLLLAGLGLLAAFVFAWLPRWASPPVLITGSPAAPAPEAETVGPREAASAPGATTTAPAGPRPVSDPPSPRRGASPAIPDEFSPLVSSGFAALDRGAFAEAQDAFGRAEALRPGTAAVADGLARTRAGLLGQALGEHRQRAEEAEAREDWRAALGEYDAALRLEPAVAFAVAGRIRCVERAALDERLQRYLDRPDRLAAEAVAREAATVLEQAAEARPVGPRLSAQRAALESLLAGVHEPVPVRLVSDGRTLVTILRVGPLGAFKEKALSLRPGSYVVVGARAGYRDARRTLLVPIGRSPEPLDVRCDEAF
jgi:tetratricopeptide (TPR) repeat protein